MSKIFKNSLILLIISSSLFAAKESSLEQTLLSLRSLDENHTTLELTTPDYSMGRISFAQADYDHIVTEMDGQIRLIGSPDLPSTSTLLAVPETGELTLDFTYANMRVESNINLAPFQPVQLETEGLGTTFQKDMEVYARDAWFPETPAILHERITMRDLNLVTVEVTPFQYNPVRKELRIYEDLEISLNHSEPLSAPNKPISRFFEPLYQSLVPNSALVLEPNYQTPSILFIHPDNATVQLVLQNLVNWRHEKGFEVHTVSTLTTGPSNSQIKNYIQTAYDTWENPPEFVVLVGDAVGTYEIPAWIENWSDYHGEGDHPYVHLAGSDYISDAFVGRISFSSPLELAGIVSKLLSYEKNPYMTDPTWFTRALLVGDQSSSGLSTIMTNRNINEYMEASGFQNNFEVYGGSFVNEIASGINAGVSYFNYRGWLGMSGWGNPNTSSLTNGTRLPFVTILTCGTGSYNGDSRSEQFLRVGTSIAPKGAIACVGTATSGTHTLYNNCVSVGIYHGLFNEGIHYAGAALERGRVNLNQTYPSTSNNYVKIFSHWNNLMGDPSTELWTGVPASLNVNAPTEIPLDAQYLDIQVTGTLGFGIEGAWVSVTGAGVFETGYTDSDGMLVIDIPSELPNDLTLTVTKHNHKPEQSSIAVGDENFSVLIDASTLVETSGNGDSQLNPGESVQLDWTFSNHGLEKAYNVSIDVTGEDGSSASHFYDSLDVAESVTLNNQNFTIASDFPGMARFDISIDIEADGVGYTDHRRFDVFAPYLQINEIGETGMPPYSFDPGEISDLVIYGENIGSLTSSNLTAILRCADENVLILDSTAVFNDAAPGELSDNSSSSFRINLNTQVTVGVQIPFQVEFTDDNGFVEIRSILLPIGTSGIGDPLGPDAGGYFCYSDQDLAYALAPEYDWIEIKPGLGPYNGVLVPLSDFGEDQEDIDPVALPFNFGFYGVDYNQISVCSNGYIAFGESGTALFRNYHIPGPLGPNPMVAAFWDDLKQWTGGGVYTFYNSVDNYFVIEWSTMKNRFGDYGWSPPPVETLSSETFQIILYDPDFYGSTDGNGDIKIQYKTFNNVNYSEGTDLHGSYATVGIEGRDALVGLEYTYNNTYPLQAHPLTDGSAILFTTRTDAVLPCPGWARGDVNHDGYRNVQDLIILVNTILGQTTIGECELWAADLSLDSNVTVSDVVLLVNEVLGNSLARTAAPDLGHADIIVDHENIVLRSSAPMGGFTFDLVGESHPIPVSHDGLTVMTREIEGGLRVLGYWSKPAGSVVELFQLQHSIVEINYPEVVDNAGVLMQTEVVRIPESFSVTSVFPNPFNPTVNISYNLPRSDEVSIHIYNALGQEVNYSKFQLPAGGHTFTWDGLNQSNQLVSSGIYFARITGAAGSEMVKLTLLR